MQRLRRQDSPPEGGPHIFVRRLKAKEHGFFTILSQKFWGCWTHWDGARTLPCTADDATCFGHQRGLPCKWKGYLSVWNHESKHHEFLEVTRVCALQILGQVSKDENLRSFRLNCKRGGSDKSRVSVEVKHGLQTREELPKEIDPQDTLERLWELNGSPKLAQFSSDELADVG